MYTLYKSIGEYYFRHSEYCILLLGIEGSGKTYLLQKLKRIIGDTALPLAKERIVPTVGLNIAKGSLTPSLDVLVWDLGGSVPLRSLWANYFEEADLIIYVMNITSEILLDDSYQVLMSLLDNEVLLRDKLFLVYFPHRANSLDRLFERTFPKNDTLLRIGDDRILFFYEDENDSVEMIRLKKKLLSLNRL